MNNKNQETLLIKIFEKVGIYVDDKNFNADLSLDSLQLISVLCEIEKTFAFRFSTDDYFYTFSDLRSFNDFIYLISSCKKNC